MARIVVVGAGIIGVTSAFVLARAGHSVTLVDRNARPCQGASQRNGAQLSYSYCDALASPALLRHLPDILRKRDPAYRVKFHLDPEFLLWGLRLLANATPSRFLRNTETLLGIAQSTQQQLAALIRTHDMKFDYQQVGKMVILPDDAAVQSQKRMIAWKQDRGIEQFLLTRSEAELLEPFLRHYRGDIAGVVHSPQDAVGSPSQFSEELLKIAENQMSLQTRFGLTAKSLIIRNDRVAGVQLDKEDPIACDAVVVATGVAASLKSQIRHGFSDVWPVHGYSATIPAADPHPIVSLTDLRRKMVFARVGNEMRVAGVADIGRSDLAFDADRFDSFRQVASDAFAGHLDLGHVDVAAWTGARPCTPSSVPVIGRGATQGLYLNYGHGTLGWTLCLGAAEHLKSCIAEN